MPRFASVTPATILVVEDEAIIRIELAARLAEMGFKTLTAGDADEAIALLDANPDITLLFTDIRMPGSMDGLRLANHVRLRWPPVKIIVASGLIDTQLSALPDDSIFLPKPFWPAAVTDALRAHGVSASRAPRRSDQLAAAY